MRALCLVVMFFGAGMADADTIRYEATNLGGNEWRYDYTLRNTGVDAIAQFTIYFDPDLYSDLDETTALGPSGWDVLVIQPDRGLPDDGFFDALNETSPVLTGETLTGFSVSFFWLGTGAPGSQPFDILDPVTFAPLVSGTTTIVPLPAPISLCLLGLAGLQLFRRRQLGKLKASRREFPSNRLSTEAHVHAF